MSINSTDVYDPTHSRIYCLHISIYGLNEEMASYLSSNEHWNGEENSHRGHHKWNGDSHPGAAAIDIKLFLLSHLHFGSKKARLFVPGKLFQPCVM
jgi:hypothetical protein